MKAIFLVLAGVSALFGLIQIALGLTLMDWIFTLTGVLTLLNASAWYIVAQMYSEVKYLDAEVRILRSTHRS